MPFWSVVVVAGALAWCVAAVLVATVWARAAVELRRRRDARRD